MQLDSLSKRVDFVMQQYGYNVDYDKLASKLNVSPEEILRMVLKNEAKEVTLIKFENILGINQKWLLSGIGSIYLNTEVKEEQKINIHQNNVVVQVNNYYNCNISQIYDGIENNIKF